MEEIMQHPEEEDVKITRAAQLQGSNLKRKLLNMTDDEAYTYLNKMKLDAYREGYADCLRKD